MIVYLRRGRWVDAERPDEVIASEVFVDANGLQPGNRVAAVINGRRRSLTIVGIGLSPEYVYGIRPGEIFPDKQRFGIFWMGRRALASAFDMEGGFNDITLKLARDASSPEVIAALDRLTAPYGGRGAISQALQPSAWTLENELEAAPDLRVPRAADLFRGGGVRSKCCARAGARAPASADRRAQGFGLLQPRACLALPEVGDGHRPIRRVRRRADRRVAWFGHDWLVQRVLPVPESRLPPVVRRCHRLGASEPRRRRGWRAVLGASRGPHRPGRGHAAGSASTLPSECFRAAPGPLAGDDGEPDDPAEPGTGAGPFVRIDSRHCLRSRRAVRRTRLRRRHEPAHQRAVRPVDASGRHDRASWNLDRRAPSYEIQHLPGVMDVEPQRTTPVRLRHGSRSRTLAIAGMPADSTAESRRRSLGTRRGTAK